MKDPKRLVDLDSSASPALRVLLRVGRSELPDQERLARMARELGATVAAGAATSVSPGATSSLRSLSKTRPVAAFSKIAVAAAVAIGGVAAAYVGVRQSITAIHPGPTPSASVTKRGTPAPVPPPRATGLLEPLMNSGPVPSASQAIPQGAATTSRPRSTPGVSPAAEASSTSVRSEPPHGEQGAAFAVSPPETPDEVTILRRARAVIRTDASAALRLAEEHKAHYPSGALAQEREVIAIEALVSLGRSAEAWQRAERFARDYPGSAHWPRIAALVGAKESVPVHNP
jgi:hypothetical protein